MVAFLRKKACSQTVFTVVQNGIKTLRRVKTRGSALNLESRKGLAILCRAGLEFWGTAV